MLQINIFFMFLDHFDTLVATQFFTHVFDSFLEKTKNSTKKKGKPQKKNAFWYIYIIFSIFNVISEEF